LPENTAGNGARDQCLETKNEIENVGLWIIDKSGFVRTSTTLSLGNNLVVSTMSIPSDFNFGITDNELDTFWIERVETSTADVYSYTLFQRRMSCPAVSE
jgi:hypothetical protein